MTVIGRGLSDCGKRGRPTTVSYRLVREAGCVMKAENDERPRVGALKMREWKMQEWKIQE